jgi:uncharacterized membrane protein YqjE
MTEDPFSSAGGTLGEYMGAAGRNRSMADVVKDIIADVQGMIRSEVRLAKAELREEAGKSADAAKQLGAGAALALAAAAFALVAVYQVLTLFVAPWIAALLLTLALGIPGMMLITKGRARLRVPTPQKTIDNVKENVEWMKNQTRS